MLRGTLARWAAMRKRRTAAVLAVSVLAALSAPVAPVSAQQAGDDSEDARTYPDTPAGTYFAEPVARLAEQGLFEGTLCEGGFCPDDATDRKTMAVWVVRMLDGEDPQPVSASRFNDVSSDSFYAPFIERMFELEVTTGCGDGSGFCPGRPVTRAQMAVFLSRAYGLAEGPDPGFSDVAVDAWYARDVAKLVTSGITKGCGDGSGFCPDLDTTRAQMATFLWRATGLSPTADCSFTESAPAVAASVFQVITDFGLGTAFYIGNDEFMTAAHVLEGVGTGELTLRNEAGELTAAIVGADFETDIAVLSAPAEGLEPLRFGSVAGLDLGHPLGVVGYPLYETPSASLVTGVLSRIEDDNTLGTLVQTDAAINSGNSGGPVVDVCGRVLGMAVLKAVGPNVEGIAYAISADTLTARLQQAREAGTSGGPPPDGSPDEGPLNRWSTWSGTSISGHYVGASLFGFASGATVQLALSCYPDNQILGLDVSFQTAGRSFDSSAASVSVEYRFGSQGASVSETWMLVPGDRGSTDVVVGDAAQQKEFVRLFRADDSDTLQVDLGDSISVQMDLTGAEQSAFPVLEACGY